MPKLKIIYLEVYYLECIFIMSRYFNIVCISLLLLFNFLLTKGHTFCFICFQILNKKLPTWPKKRFGGEHINTSCLGDQHLAYKLNHTLFLEEINVILFTNKSFLDFLFWDEVDFNAFREKFVHKFKLWAYVEFFSWFLEWVCSILYI